MALYTEQDQIKFLERIAIALEILAKNTTCASYPAPQEIKPAPITHKKHKLTHPEEQPEQAE